jgi:folate-dependent phosphoribosylglycinamide formyltransferase PurN
MDFEIFFNRHGVRAAIFMSGSGNNAEALLSAPPENWRPVALVTDYPQSSRAGELARRFDIPLIEEDIRAFYAAHGLSSIALSTERGREVRDLWTESLRRKLAPFNVDFGILAGFVSLTNLTSDFPCLNIHPGDLTCEADGRRLLVGLHTVPVEKAILEGLPYLRSSVIVAMPFKSEADIDSGPILGISEPVPVELDGMTLDELRAVAAARPPRKPAGGWGDRLEALAKAHQERLKFHGDLVIYPRIVEDFAAGNFRLQGHCLYYKSQPVRTVEYQRKGVCPIPAL